jgi:hypothetical protein
MIQNTTKPEATPELLREAIRDQLSRSVLKITFTKANGEVRVLQGTLNGDLINYTSTGPSRAEQSPPRADDVQPVWDVEANAWRSFRWDSIISIT